MKILHLEIECCYGCPNCTWNGNVGWEYLERTGESGYYYCSEAWNNDETNNEERYILKNLGDIPGWCPLPDKAGVEP